MSGVPRISGITQDLPENESRLHGRLRRGRYGENLTGIDFSNLSKEQKKTLRQLGHDLKKINITSFFSVLAAMTEFDDIDKEEFFEEYIADAEKRVGGKGSEDSEIKKREKKAVESILEVYSSYKDNDDGINPYLTFLLEINEYTVVDDIDALQYQIVYEMYVAEYGDSLDEYEMLADLSLDGGIEEPGLINEKELHRIMSEAQIVLGINKEQGEGKKQLLQRLLDIIGYTNDEETDFNSVLQENPYVLQRIHQFFKTTPPSDLFGVLVGADMEETVEEKNQLLIETLETVFEGQLDAMKEQADDLPAEYEGEAVALISQMEQMSPEVKRRWFASLIGMISQEGVDGGAGIISVNNPFEIDREAATKLQSIIADLSFSLVPVVQKVGETTVPTVIIGSSWSQSNRVSDRVTHFHSYGLGTGMTLVSGSLFMSPGLSMTQGITVGINESAMDGYGNDALISLQAGVGVGLQLSEGELHGSVGVSMVRDKLQGHERELAAKEEPIKTIVTEMLRNDAYTIQQGVEVLQGMIDNRRKALRIQGKIEDLVQYVSDVVEQFKRTGLLEDTNYFINALTGSILNSFDEAGLLNLKEGWKSIYISRFGVAWDIDFKNFLKTLGSVATAPWKLFSISGTGHSKLGYQEPTMQEIQESINASLQTNRGLIAIDETSNCSDNVIDAVNPILGYEVGSGLARVTVGQGDSVSEYLGIPLGYNVAGHELSIVHEHHGIDFSRYCMTKEFEGQTYLVVPEKMPLAIRTYQQPNGTILHTVLLGDRVIDDTTPGTGIDMSQTYLVGMSENPADSLYRYDRDLFEVLQEEERRESVKNSINTLINSFDTHPFDADLVTISDNLETLTLGLEEGIDISILGAGVGFTENADGTITIPYGTHISCWYASDSKSRKMSLEPGGNDSLIPLELGVSIINSFSTEKEVKIPIGLEELPQEYKNTWETDGFRDFIMTLRYSGTYGQNSQPSTDRNRYNPYLKAIEQGNFEEGKNLLETHKTQFDALFGAGKFEEWMGNEGTRNVILKQIEGDLSLTYMTEFKHLQAPQAKEQALSLLDDVKILDDAQRRTLEEIIPLIFDSETPVTEFNVHRPTLETLFKAKLSRSFRYDAKPATQYGYLLDPSKKELAQIMIMLMPAGLIMDSRAAMYRDAILNSQDYLGNSFAQKHLITEEGLRKNVSERANGKQSLASNGSGTGSVEQGVVGLVATYGSGVNDPIKRKQTPNPRMEPGTFIEVTEINTEGNLDFLQRQYLHDLFKDNELADKYREHINSQLESDEYTYQGNQIDSKQELIEFLLNPDNGTFVLRYGMYGPCKNRLKTHSFVLKGYETETTTLNPPDLEKASVMYTEAPGSVVYGSTVWSNDPNRIATTVGLSGITRTGGETINADSETNPEVSVSPDSQALAEIIEENDIQLGVSGTYEIGGRIFEGMFVRDALTGNISFQGVITLSPDQLNHLQDINGTTLTYSDRELIRFMQGGNITDE